MEPKNEIQPSEQLQLPVLIAITNGSGSSKSISLAHELAMSLKCPLIDEHDISQALAKISLATSSNAKSTGFPDELNDKLPFEAICQIVATQLSLKIKVVIRSLLSSPDHFDRLDELASSSGALLVIIDSQIGDRRNNDSDSGRVLKLHVNMDSFDANQVIADMSSKLSHKANQVSKDDLSSINSAFQDKDERYKKMKQPTNDHVHALTLLEKPRKGKLKCKSCTELVSSSCYQCVVCDEFILHKLCAESAANIEVISKKCPPFLKSMKPNYDFEKKYKCSDCEEFSYKCYDCLLQTHLNNKFLPTILYHHQHQHLLNFIMMPLKYNYQYKCCACDNLGNSVSYKCFDCNFDVHVKCLLPGTIQLQNDQHCLFLTSQIDSGGENYCDICGRKRELGQLFYQCDNCDFAFHVRCMPDLSKSTIPV